MPRDFEKHSNCGLCGLPMIHSRLWGYQCSNLSHRQILNAILEQCVEESSFDEFEAEYERRLNEKRKELGYLR